MYAFDQPLRGRDLSGVEAELVALRKTLEATHGQPVYFPLFRAGQLT
jgi:hypothetical protein